MPLLLPCPALSWRELLIPFLVHGRWLLRSSGLSGPHHALPRFLSLSTHFSIRPSLPLSLTHYFFSRLDCQLSPDSVENDLGGCSWETCVGEYPHSRLDTLGTSYVSECSVQQCVYVGYNYRLILTSTKTLRYSNCGRLKFRWL